MIGDRVRDWWPKKPKQDDTPDSDQFPTLPDIPTRGKTNVLALLWKLWRLRIDLKKFWPAVVSIPVLLFFVISGVLAWLALLLGFFWKIFHQIVALCS